MPRFVVQTNTGESHRFQYEQPKVGVVLGYSAVNLIASNKYTEWLLKILPFTPENSPTNIATQHSWETDNTLCRHLTSNGFIVRPLIWNCFASSEPQKATSASCVLRHYRDQFELSTSANMNDPFVRQLLRDNSKALIATSTGANKLLAGLKCIAQNGKLESLSNLKVIILHCPNTPHDALSKKMLGDTLHTFLKQRNIRVIVKSSRFDPVLYVAQLVTQTRDKKPFRPLGLTHHTNLPQWVERGTTHPLGHNHITSCPYIAGNVSDLIGPSKLTAVRTNRRRKLTR
jgi:hypothetical protein